MRVVQLAPWSHCRGCSNAHDCFPCCYFVVPGSPLALICVGEHMFVYLNAPPPPPRCPHPCPVVGGCINVTKTSDSPTAFSDVGVSVPALTSPMLARRRRRASATTVETSGDGVQRAASQHRPPVKFTPTSGGMVGTEAGGSHSSRVLSGGYVPGHTRAAGVLCCCWRLVGEDDWVWPGRNLNSQLMCLFGQCCVAGS